MNVDQIEDLRARFEAFVGKDDYEKFVDDINCWDRRIGRLTYWQEKLWGAFAKADNKLPRCEYEVLAPLFYICPVHRCSLEEGSVRVLYGLRRPRHDWREMSRRFPFARRSVNGGCMVRRDAPRTRRVDFCPECRKGIEQYERERGINS